MNKIPIGIPLSALELPGPKARALLARDAEVVSPSYPREHPFVMSHGRGVEVWDVDGNRFLDFAAGIAVCSTAIHTHRWFRRSKTLQIGFWHISSDYWHEGQVALAEKINALAPMGEPVQSFFCQSGTERWKAQLKLARYVSGRSRFIGFLGGFHGRTMGSLAFTASKQTQQQRLRDHAGCHPRAVSEYLPTAVRGEDQGQAVLNYIENGLFVSNVPASEVAAILVEPIQGEGGYLVPPDGFLAGLRQLCNRHGILLIFDEVQSGIGPPAKCSGCTVQARIHDAGPMPDCTSSKINRMPWRLQSWRSPPEIHPAVPGSHLRPESARPGSRRLRWPARC